MITRLHFSGYHSAKEAGAPDIQRPIIIRPPALDCALRNGLLFRVEPDPRDVANGQEFEAVLQVLRAAVRNRGLAPFGVVFAGNRPAFVHGADDVDGTLLGIEAALNRRVGNRTLRRRGDPHTSACGNDWLVFQ